MYRYKDLIKNYFEKHSLVDSNIRSFNNFMEKGIQKIITETQDVLPTIIPSEVSEFKIKLGKIEIEKPQIVESDGSKRKIYPTEARLRKLTYSAPVYLDVSAVIDGVERESFKALIGKIPVMVKSKFCNLHGLSEEKLVENYEDPNDPGGYFILNGNERVLIIVEDLASNKFFVEKNKVGPSQFVGKVYSEKGSYRIPHIIEQMRTGTIYLTFTRFNRVPIIAVIKALGLIRDEEIAKTISEDNQYDDIFINLYETVEIKTQDDAVEFLAKKIGIAQPIEVKLEKTREQLDKYLLPHVGSSSKDRLLKAYNLCKLIKKFLMASEEGVELTDKDHYINKRLKLSGDLFEDLLRINLKTLVQDVMYNFQRLVKRGKFQSIKIIIRDELLSSNIKSSLATGSWTGGRKGISQNIDRTNIVATASHLQRVVSLLTSTQENFEARALHPTHFGRLCPIETPEGTSIGLRKNLAILCNVSQETITDDKIKKLLEGSGLKLIEK